MGRFCLIQTMLPPNRIARQPLYTSILDGIACNAHETDTQCTNQNYPGGFTLTEEIPPSLAPAWGNKSVR